MRLLIFFFLRVITKTIAIIGAGPAGIYTARLLANQGCRVTLFEQNPKIGRKLRITGGGRMNVGNKEFSVSEFSSSQLNLLKRLFKNPHFKRRDEILAELGIEFVWQENRAILRSGDARIEVDRLDRALKSQQNLSLRLGEAVTRLVAKDGKFQVNQNAFDTVVIAHGGMYRMGDLKSRAEIYDLVLRLGHTVTPVAPSLGAMMFDDAELSRLSGLAFVGKLIDLEQGRSVTDDILITHIGLSGPACLDFTAQFCSSNIELCFLPQMTEEVFRKKINSERDGITLVRTFLKNFLPQRLASELIRRSDIKSDQQITHLKKTELGALCKTLFHTPLPPLRDNIYPSCWTTCGGVPLDEVQTATLESRIIPQLYFAGEVLDINGLCGGYNIGFASVAARIVVDAIERQLVIPA